MHAYGLINCSPQWTQNAERSRRALACVSWVHGAPRMDAFSDAPHWGQWATIAVVRW